MRKPVFLIACLLVFVCLFSLPVLSALAMESTCPPSFDVSVVLISGEKELSVYSDTEKTARVGRLPKGVTAQVIGAEGRYLRIAFEGVEGYAAKSKLRLKATESQAERNGTAVTDLALDTYLFTSTSKAKSMAIHGTVETAAPLDTLYVFLWDERLQRVEQTLVLPVRKGANIPRRIRPPRMVPTWKRSVFTSVTGTSPTRKHTAAVPGTKWACSLSRAASFKV